MGITQQQKIKIASYIVSWEARRDNQGRLKVYQLPSGDRGGSYEVAGINNRYHPAEAKKLKRLIYQGKYTEAEEEICRYIAGYTDRVDEWIDNVALQCYLRDSSFNRGPTGAAKILQLALDVDVDGIIGPATQQAIAQCSPEQLLVDLREARELYEMRYMKRDKSSKFWVGLTNRWNKALIASQSFLTNTTYKETRKPMFFAIDIGHNCGSDSGAVAIGNENKLNRDVGDRLIELLEERGHKTIMVTPKTAPTPGVSLRKRVNKANQSGADAYVSIHFNCFSSQKAKGSEVFAYRPNTQGASMAQSVLNEILKLGFTNRGVKYKGFYVVKNTSMPAILVECCFVSNPGDMQKLDTNKMAVAIANGLVGEEPVESSEIKGNLVVTVPTYVKPSTDQMEDIDDDELLKLKIGSYPAFLVGEEEGHYCIDFTNPDIDAQLDRDENFIYCGHAKFEES